jgi:hypothetical protein
MPARKRVTLEQWGSFFRWIRPTVNVQFKFEVVCRCYWTLLFHAYDKRDGIRCDPFVSFVIFMV